MRLNACRGALRELAAPLLFALWVAAPVQAHAAPKVAVLEFELLKSELLPGGARPSAEEAARMRMVANLVRERLATEGYEVVSGEETRAATERYNPIQYLHDCNGCERDIAAMVEADWVVVGWAQIVSYLIQNINVLVLEVSTGRRLAQSFVDLRGFTDESFRHATVYLLDNALVERLGAHQ